MYDKTTEKRVFGRVVSLCGWVGAEKSYWEEGNIAPLEYWPLPDYDAPPLGVLTTLAKSLLDSIKRRQKVLVFCHGGHGRTGLVLAACLVIAEPEVENPVEEIRKRLCINCIESVEQVSMVFELAGREVPKCLKGSKVAQKGVIEAYYPTLCK